MALGESTQPVPNNPLYGTAVKMPVQELTDDGAIAIPGGVVHLNKAGVIAATLAVPDTNGLVLFITSKTAQAHTLTVASGIYGLGTSYDVGTFGGAIGDGVILVSYGGYWCPASNTNVTWA